jgi:hypothetical protein
VLTQAPKDGFGNFRPGRLGFCGDLQLECAAIDPFDHRRILVPSRSATLAYQPREFTFHGMGNSVAVARGKAVQHQFLDVNADRVTSAQRQVTCDE